MSSAAAAASAGAGAGAGAKKKTLLVFGGTGYVGRRIVYHALNKGYEVTSISRSGQAPFGFPDAWRVQWLACDVTNRRAVEEVLTKVSSPVDAVISSIGFLTLDRTTAIQLNGTTNTNVVAALYNRQRLILKDRWETEQEEKKEAKAKKLLSQKQEQEKKNTEKASTSSNKDEKKNALENVSDKNSSSSKDVSTETAPQHEVIDEHLPFYKYVPAPIPEENKLPLDLPPLTDHQSGIPRFVFVSAASFGFPFTRILRAYYDGKIATERAMMDHCKGRGVVLRPGAIYGTRYTASNVPIFLTPWFWPMELLFAPIFRLTGGRIKFLQPPVNVDDVACAAIQAASEDVEADEQLMKSYKIDAGYGHARGGVPNYVDRSRKQDHTPIFDHDGITYLASKFRQQ